MPYQNAQKHHNRSRNNETTKESNNFGKFFSFHLNTILITMQVYVWISTPPSYWLSYQYKINNLTFSFFCAQVCAVWVFLLNKKVL